MRSLFVVLPALILAAPAAGQEAPEASEAIEIPSELTDPATADRLGDMLGALTRSMMDLKIGEMIAVAEGRTATPAERNRTVREVAGGDDPDFERKLADQAEKVGPLLQRGMAAMAKALPAMVGAMREFGAEMGEDMERATANVPQPGYPKR